MITPKNYTPKPNSLRNKLILITGAAHGLGRTLALSLAKLGANIILLDKDLTGLENVYDEIITNNYAKPVLHPLDLLGATPNDYSDMQDGLKSFSRLDGLIHNAAIIGTMMPIGQYDIKIWYEVIQTNLNAPFLLTKYCLPLLLKSPSARIIFISDKHGRKPSAYWGAYGVSKSALESLALTLADELASTNITTNTLDPGVMKTKLRGTTHPAENLTKQQTNKQLIYTISYLFSSNAKKINAKQLGLN